MPVASLSPVVCTLRVHEGEDGPPAPYVGSATVLMRSDAVAEIQGLTMSVPWTASLRRAVMVALRDAGARFVVWDRIDDAGEARRVMVPLQKETQQ